MPPAVRGLIPSLLLLTLACGSPEKAPAPVDTSADEAAIRAIDTSWNGWLKARNDSAIAGLPVAFALAVVVFLFAFIPTVGAIFSGLLVVLVALVSQGPTTALVMALVVLVVQQLDANVMYPILASRHLALHPLASLLLVAAGGVLAGLFGAFIAVPLAAVALAVGSSLRMCNDAPHG